MLKITKIWYKKWKLKKLYHSNHWKIVLNNNMTQDNWRKDRLRYTLSLYPALSVTLVQFTIHRQRRTNLLIVLILNVLKFLVDYVRSNPIYQRHVKSIKKSSKRIMFSQSNTRSLRQWQKRYFESVLNVQKNSLKRKDVTKWLALVVLKSATFVRKL